MFRTPLFFTGLLLLIVLAKTPGSRMSDRPDEELSVRPAEAITCLYVDEAYRLTWIGGRDGLILSDGVQRVRFTVKDGLPDSHVLAIERVGAELWAATPKGLARFANGKWTRVDAPNAVFDAIAPTENGACLATDDGRLFCYENGDWTQLDGGGAKAAGATS